MSARLVNKTSCFPSKRIQNPHPMQRSMCLHNSRMLKVSISQLVPFIVDLLFQQLITTLMTMASEEGICTIADGSTTSSKVGT